VAAARARTRGRRESVHILGLEIPRAGPAFYAILAVHVPVGLAAVIAGAAAALSLKGSPRHLGFGRLYYWALGVFFATASIVATLRWQEDWPLFLVGAAAFLAACMGHFSRPSPPISFCGNDAAANQRGSSSRLHRSLT